MMTPFEGWRGDHLLSQLKITAASTEEAVEDAIQIYRIAKSVAEEAKAVQDAAKAKLAEIIEETGQTTWATEAGKAIVTAPGMSVSWDTKGIDALMAEDGLMRAKLAPFRTEKERPGSLRITAAK